MAFASINRRAIRFYMTIKADGQVTFPDDQACFFSYLCAFIITANVFVFLFVFAVLVNKKINKNQTIHRSMDRCIDLLMY